MSIARVIMHEMREEGTHHKLEEIYAKIFDEYFPNLEQVITSRQAQHQVSQLRYTHPFRKRKKILLVAQKW